MFFHAILAQIFLLIKTLNYLSEFPECIRVNEVLAAPINMLGDYGKVFKTYSADMCAKKGKEDSQEFHATDKRVLWSWYSSTTECVIHIFYDQPFLALVAIESGNRNQ